MARTSTAQTRWKENTEGDPQKPRFPLEPLRLTATSPFGRGNHAKPPPKREVVRSAGGGCNSALEGQHDVTGFIREAAEEILLTS